MSKKKNIDKMRTPSVGAQVFSFSGLAPVKMKPKELAEKLGVLEEELKEYLTSLIAEMAGEGFVEGDWISWDEIYSLLDNFYVGLVRIIQRTIINEIGDIDGVGGGGGFDNITAGEGIDITGDNRDIEISGEDSAADNKGIVIVAPGEGIDVSYASGTATVSTAAEGNIVRRAITTAAAGAATTITANLYDEDGAEQTTGDESGLTIYCSVIGGGNLNAAIPRLEDNDDIWVAKLPYSSEADRWYCLKPFQAIGDGLEVA